MPDFRTINDPPVASQISYQITNIHGGLKQTGKPKCAGIIVRCTMAAARVKQTWHGVVFALFVPALRFAAQARVVLGSGGRHSGRYFGRRDRLTYGFEPPCSASSILPPFATHLLKNSLCTCPVPFALPAAGLPI